ncbi:MAG: GAF domain-containing protein, partial [Candidatus Binatia bacterium]
MKFSIRTKLIAFGLFIALLVGGGISVYSIYLGRERITNNFEREARAIAGSVAQHIVDDLYFLNLRSLRLHLETARTNRDLLYTVVTDSHGAVLSDGTEENVRRGDKLTDAFSTRSLQATGLITEFDKNLLKVGGPVLAPDGKVVGHLHFGFTLETTDQNVWYSIRASLLVTGICLILGALFAVLFSVSFTRPIQSMVQAAKNIGQGDLRTRVPLTRHDELGTLAQSINDMATALELRVSEQEALSAIALATSQSFHLEQILQTALDKVLEVTRRERGYIRLRNSASGEISLAAHRGISQQHVHALLHQRTPGGKCDQAFSTGKVIVVNEPTALKESNRSDGTHAAIWIPLNSRDEVIGVLNVTTVRPIAFTDREVNLLATIGSVLGVALENARLFSETNKSLKRIQSLRDIDQAVTSTLDLQSVLDIFLRNIGRLFPYSIATIRLFNKDTKMIESVACWNLPAEEWKARTLDGIPLPIRAVLEGKAPVFTKNLRSEGGVGDAEFFQKHGVVSSLGLPLIAKGEPIGVLSLYTKFEHSFTHEEIEFCFALAGQAAMAIHNSQLYEQTKNQAAALDRANRLQADFTAMIAHDLRSPMQNVIGVVTMMEDGVFGAVNDNQRKWLGKVITTSHGLVNLVSDFLDLTKIEAGRVDLVKEDVDFTQLIEITLENHLLLAQERGITLRAQADPSLTPVYADPRRLGQVLNNLLSNAIKFTPQG